VDSQPIVGSDSWRSGLCFLALAWLRGRRLVASFNLAAQRRPSSSGLTGRVKVGGRALSG